MPEICCSTASKSTFELSQSKPCTRHIHKHVSTRALGAQDLHDDSGADVKIRQRKPKAVHYVPPHVAVAACDCTAQPREGRKRPTVPAGNREDFCFPISVLHMAILAQPDLHQQSSCENTEPAQGLLGHGQRTGLVYPSLRRARSL